MDPAQDPNQPLISDKPSRRAALAHLACSLVGFGAAFALLDVSDAVGIWLVVATPVLGPVPAFVAWYAVGHR